MAILPEFLQNIIECHLELLLRWFSDHVYEQLLPTFDGHPLLQVDDLLDLDPIEAACADFHKNNGMGRPVTHNVPRLVRALLVRYFYDASLRETEALIRENIPVKWFVGYPLASKGVSYTRLHHFEQYVLAEQPRLFFDTILAQIFAHFPDQCQQPHLADTFALLADAQLETLIGRLRHGAARLLLALHRQDPGRFRQVTDALEMEALLGQEEEALEFLLNATEKQARLEATVAQVQRLLDVVASLHPRPADIREYEQFLRDVVAKELELTVDETGAVTAVRVRDERGTYRPTSATDPDATIRNHGKGKRDNGYNASVLATTDFVIEIRAATGSEPDAAGLVPLLDEVMAHQDYRPEKLIYDQAAGDGKTIAAVHQASKGQTQLVVKPKKKKGDRFGPLACTLTDVVDEETGERHPALTCPGGQTTTTRYRAGSGSGWTYRVPVEACAACPLKKPCRGTKVDPDRYRQWYISDYRAPLLAALAYAETNAFKADMTLRPQIERVIAILVQHNGARHARFRGREKVDFQVKMCAAVYNLKRWLTLSDPKKRRRKPRGSAAQAVLRLVGAN